MAGIFSKLNLTDQQEIVVLNAPESFEPELAALPGVKVVRSVASAQPISFALAFAIRQKERDALCTALAKKAAGDAVIWIAYPKGTSKKYHGEFNRDSGWSVLGAAGFEPVRQVAIDADWSALRFRRVEYIKTMRRRESMAVSKAGKEKVRK